MRQIVTMPVAAIQVVNRRRIEFGDIDGLAESIQRWGLLHPLVVDDEGRLIAGERRLRACQQLGMSEIPVRRWGSLTDSERQEIELEENVRRKDLTPYERSLEIVKLSDVAAENLRTQPTPIRGFSPESGKNPLGGRPPKPDSQARIAEKIGIPQQTINDAKRHVAAVQEMPPLAGATQADVLKIKTKLDAMPAEERTVAVEAVRRSDADTLARLTDRPPIPPDVDNPHEFAAKQRAGRRWIEAIEEIRMRVNSIRDHGGISVTTADWSHERRADLYEEIDRLIAQLAQIRDELREAIDAA